MKKISAFTLSELLVVLVISSLVVTLSFLALGNVQKQVKNVTKNLEKQQMIGKLERLLSTDLNRYDAVYNIKEQELILRGARDSVVYLFTKTAVFRQKDSIMLTSDTIRLYLDGKEVKSGAIDAIELGFSSTYSSSSLFVYKRKDAAHYINP